MVTPCGLPPGAVSPGAALACLAKENLHINMPQKTPAAVPASSPAQAAPSATSGPPDLQPFGSIQFNTGAAAKGDPATPVLTGGAAAETPKAVHGSRGGGAAAAVNGMFAFPTPASGVTGSGRRRAGARRVQTPKLLPGVTRVSRASQRSIPPTPSASKKSHPLAPPPPPASIMHDPVDICRIQTT